MTTFEKTREKIANANQAGNYSFILFVGFCSILAAVVTSVGGGTFRDHFVLDRLPFWLRFSTEGYSIAIAPTFGICIGWIAGLFITLFFGSTRPTALATTVNAIDDADDVSLA